MFRFLYWCNLILEWNIKQAGEMVSGVIQKRLRTTSHFFTKWTQSPSASYQVFWMWTLWIHIDFQLLDFFSKRTIIPIGLSQHGKQCCVMKNWDWIILKGFRKWMNLQYIYVFLLFWSKKEWHIFPVQLRGSFMSSLNPPRMCKY